MTLRSSVTSSAAYIGKAALVLGSILVAVSLVT